MLNTHVSGLLNYGGKACVENVGTLWQRWGQKVPVFHMPTQASVRFGISTLSTRNLYTKCIQVLDSYSDISTSVKSQFYTLYTGPIITTTTFKLILRRAT